MAKIIKLKENDILKLVQEVINEQLEGDPTLLTINDAVHYIEDLINNKILPEMQTEILNRYTIKVRQNPDRSFSIILKTTMNGKVTESPIELEQITNSVYSGAINGKFLVGNIKTKELLDEVKKDQKVAEFLAKYPKFEEEILNGLINVVLSTQGRNEGVFKLSFFGIKRGKLENSIPAGQEYPLGDFFNQNRLAMVVNNEVGAVLESGYMELALSKFYFSGPGVESYASTDGEKTTTGSTTPDTVIKLPFNLVDAFKFDEDNFNDEATAMTQIDNLVNTVKMGVNRFGNELVQHIMGVEPKIIGYASVDADPSEKITGKFAPCKSKPNRGEYNKCLSEFRAKKIADILNKKLEGTGVSFGYFGAGETTKFGPGWTKEKPTTTKDTAPNRRFVLTPIPPFSKVIKGK